MSRPRRPIPWEAHRLRRSDPARRRAEVERNEAGLLPVVPTGVPRLRAGARGAAMQTPYQRKQQERALDDGRPTWRQRLRSILRLRAGGVR